VDPITCSVKLQESKLRPDKQISWSVIGSVLRNKPKLAKKEEKEVKTDNQFMEGMPVIVKIETKEVRIEFRIYQG